MLSLCNIANFAQRTFNIVPKSRSHRHGDIIISISTTTIYYIYLKGPQLPRAGYRVTFDGSSELTLTLYDKGVVEIRMKV